MRILLDNLKEKQSSIQVLVLQILSEIFKSESMKECWSKFVELLTLRVLDAYTENARDVILFLSCFFGNIKFNSVIGGQNGRNDRNRYDGFSIRSCR